MNASTSVLRSEITSLKQQLAQRKEQLISLASEEQGFEWQPLEQSPDKNGTCRIALLHDPEQRHGWSHIGYLGFATKREAERSMRSLRKHGTARVELRKARRLTQYKWEVKAVDVDPGVLQQA